MSGEGAFGGQPPSVSGTGQNVGFQAQVNILLQLLQRIAASLGNNTISTSTFAYAPAPITTATYNILATDAGLQFDASGGAIVANLPTAASVPGKMYFLKNAGASNNVTLTAQGSDKIDGAGTKAITPAGDLIVQSQGGTTWVIFSAS